MISLLQGTVAGTAHGDITVLVSGIGFLVHVPAGLDLQYKPGQAIELQTVMITREDSLDLYGFSDMRQKEIFSLLLNVSGVGPKTAMNIIGSIEPHMFLDEVVNENVDYLCTLPGIGKKSAQRIILDLKERIKKEFGHRSAAAKPGAPSTNIAQDAVAALMALGYSERQANGAVKGHQADDVETLIKLALKDLM